MRTPIDDLSYQLTGKQTLEDCSVEEIRQIAVRFPYFAPAQFLLLHKLRALNQAAESDAQQRKAILYYSDALAFEAFISSGKFFTEPRLSFVVSDETPLHSTFENESIENALVLDAGDELELPVAADEDTNVAAMDEQVLPVVDESLSIQKPSGIEESYRSHGQVPVEKVAEAVAAVTITEAPSQLEQPAFEPFHTVDYFASQGIKVSAADLPKDKLGKQLKSFTEWLKTMKRLPASQLGAGPESLAEKKIETLADQSVTDSNVLTEAMAEVWAKQGNRERAAQIYDKLSLLNPSKKAYFAAKIENLNES